MEEPKKRGRPRKETALALVEPEVPEPVEAPAPVKLKRTRKKPDPETAISSDVSFNSARGAVTFKAMRAPKQPKMEEKMERFG